MCLRGEKAGRGALLRHGIAPSAGSHKWGEWGRLAWPKEGPGPIDEVGAPPGPGWAAAKMADLEAVLADVSYLMAMEKSKSSPAARASKKIALPEPR